MSEVSPSEVSPSEKSELTQPPKKKRRWGRRLVVATAVAVGLYALVGFFVVPWAVQRWGVPMIAERVNGQVTVGDIRVNPFTLAAELTDIAVTDVNGTEVLGVGRFYGNLQASSLLREGFVFRQTELDAPFVRLVLEEDGRINLAALLKPSDEPSDEPATLPRVRGEGVAVRGGRVEFVDRMLDKPIERVIEPLTFDIGRFDSAPVHANEHRFAAQSLAGEQVAWEGRVFLDPLTAKGTITVEGFELTRYEPYTQRYFPVGIGSGEATLSLTYDLAPAASPPRAIAVLEQLRVVDLDVTLEGEPLLSAAQLGLDGLAVDAAERRLTVAQAIADGPALTMRRGADGQLVLLSLLEQIEAKAASGDAARGLQAVAESETDATDATAGLPKPLDEAAAAVLQLARGVWQPWEAEVAEVEVADGTVTWRDNATQPAALFEVSDASMSLGPVRSAERFAVPFEASATLGEAGTFAAQGTTEPLDRRAVLTLDTKGLDVSPFAPYAALASPLLTLAGGTLDLNGDLAVAIPEAGARSDGSEDSGAPLPPAEFATDTFRVTGQLDVAVIDVNPVVQAVLSNLDVQLEGFDTTNDEPGRLSVTALVNDAPLAVRGSAAPNLAQPLRSRVDLEVTLDGYPLTAVTGYSGRYVGRAIASGTLSTAEPITVALDDAQLDARAPVRVDDFDFGDKVESEDATSLPVGLAVAILKGPDGTIEPPPIRVTGDLSDPSVSVAGLVLHALANIVTGIAASPFQMLAGVVGGEDEGGDAAALSSVSFVPGAVDLDDRARLKLDRLVEGLNQRPALRLRLDTPPGLAAADRGALKKALLVRRLQERTAETLSQRDPRRADPSEIAVDDARYRQAVRLIYAARQGNASSAGGGTDAAPGAIDPDELPVLAPDGGEVVTAEEARKPQRRPIRTGRGGRSIGRIGGETVNDEPLFGTRVDEPEPDPGSDLTPDAASGDMGDAPPTPDAVPFVEMERFVLADLELPGDAPAELHRQRTRAVADYLTWEAGLDAERVIVAEPSSAPAGAADPGAVPRVTFELSA